MGRNMNNQELTSTQWPEQDVNMMTMDMCNSEICVLPMLNGVHDKTIR